MKILQVVGDLAPGGAEKIAVVTSNELVKKDNFEVSVCAMRSINMDLLNMLDNNVNIIEFNRSNFGYYLNEILRFRNLIKRSNYDIIHVHNSPIYFVIVSLIGINCKIIWHDNYGDTNTHLSKRNKLIHKFLLNKLHGYIAVNLSLKQWAQNLTRETNVIFVNNCSVNFNPTNNISVNLFGKKGERVVHLAHFRRQKDHITLLKAIKILTDKGIIVKLSMLGGLYDKEYVDEVKDYIEEHQLNNFVKICGLIDYPKKILENSDIGVLSSRSEGLPLTLIEYGLNKLSVVVTDVGECRTFLGGKGKIVTPNDPIALAEELEILLSSKKARKHLGNSLFEMVNQKYSVNAYMTKIYLVYS